MRGWSAPAGICGPAKPVVYGDTRSRHAGDLVADGNDSAQWLVFFSIARELLRKMAIFPVLGNHERNAGWFYDFFDLHNPYYAFDCGRAHFFMLNSDISSVAPSAQAREAFWAEQTRWMEQDLANSQKAGEYRENIVLGDGLTLLGEGLPVLRAADRSKPVVLMRGKTALESFRVTGGDDGIIVEVNTDARIVNCEIVDNSDDGIEIRLERKTRARIEGNTITGNGEDGIEIINTPVAGVTENRVQILKNTIRGNVRYGIGGVDQQTEELKEGLIIEGVALKDNVVEGNGKGQIAGSFRP